MKEEKINVGLNVNIYPKYAVVDSEKNILEKFRQKWTAICYMKKIQENYFDEKLDVILLKTGKSVIK